MLTQERIERICWRLGFIDRALTSWERIRQSKRPGGHAARQIEQTIVMFNRERLALLRELGFDPLPPWDSGTKSGAR